MRLETMQPANEWDATDHEDSIRVFRAFNNELTIRVWGGDWCKDCQALLPTFAAVLDAAEIDPNSVLHYPVEKAADGSKTGPLVEEYDIAYIPTIIIERNDSELTRFVESEDVDPATYLAQKLSELETPQ